jgi:hypothetical protein
VLHITRAGVVAAGADARRQLKALIVTAREPLRDSLRGRPWRQQLRAAPGWSPPLAIRWNTAPPCRPFA